jgi:chaperonin GroES
MSLAKKIRPLGDRVVVKRLDAEEKTKSGIIIPDNAKEKPSQGEVIAVGPGRTTDDGKTIRMELKAGDKVLFGKWAATEVKVDGEEVLVLKQDDVIAVMA